MPNDTLPLDGFTILVVEDDPLIALDVATTLADAGAGIVGPCATVDQALWLIDGAGPGPVLDAAVLDVDLGRETSVPIARVLREREVCILFHTGIHSGTAALLEEFDAPVIRKPSADITLLNKVAAELKAKVLPRRAGSRWRHAIASVGL